MNLRENIQKNLPGPIRERLDPQYAMVVAQDRFKHALTLIPGLKEIQPGMTMTLYDQLVDEYTINCPRQLIISREQDGTLTLNLETLRYIGATIVDGDPAEELRLIQEYVSVTSEGMTFATDQTLIYVFQNHDVKSPPITISVTEERQQAQVLNHVAAFIKKSHDANLEPLLGYL